MKGGKSMKTKNILIGLVTVMMVIALYLLYGNNDNSNPDIDGYTIMASQLDNKSRVDKAVLKKDINLLVIWQDSCPPCHKVLQALEGVYQDYPDIQVTGLGFGQSEEEVQAAVDRLGLTFDSYRLQEDFLDKYQDYITSTPTLLYLDKAGKSLRPKEAGTSLSDHPELAQDQMRKVLEAIQ